MEKARYKFLIIIIISSSSSSSSSIVILCSTLRHKSWLTLPVMLYRFEIHSALELSRTALLGWPAASQPLVFARLLVGNYYYIIIIIIIIITVIVIIITLRHIQ